jgi:hypothetical protein
LATLRRRSQLVSPLLKIGDILRGKPGIRRSWERVALVYVQVTGM